jgi:hypothetical protein
MTEDEQVIAMADDLLFLASGDPEIALEIAIREILSIRRHRSDAFVRVRLHDAVRPPKPKPPAVTLTSEADA